MILLVVLGTLVKLTSTFQTLRTIFILPPVAVLVSKVERPSHFIAVHTSLADCWHTSLRLAGQRVAHCCWHAAYVFQVASEPITGQRVVVTFVSGTLHIVVLVGEGLLRLAGQRCLLPSTPAVTPTWKQ